MFDLTKKSLFAAIRQWCLGGQVRSALIIPDVIPDVASIEIAHQVNAGSLIW